jgi:hypothetical protein
MDDHLSDEIKSQRYGGTSSGPMSYVRGAQEKIVSFIKNHPYVPIIIIVILVIFIIYMYVSGTTPKTAGSLLSKLPGLTNKSASKEVDEELNGVKASAEQKKEIENLVATIKKKQDE